MKKQVSYIILFVFLGACTILKTKSENRDFPVDAIISNFNNEEGSVMVVAHRANIYDSLPENSMEGILACIENGIDIIEIDIRKSKDGVLLLMHDEYVNRMTTSKGKVSHLTWDELNEMNLRLTSFGKASGYKIPRLDEVFKACNGKIMINLDKGFWFLKEAYELAIFEGVEDQIILKSYDSYSSVNEQLKDFDSFNFMPIIAQDHYSNIENIEHYLTIEGEKKPKAFELIFDNPTDSIGKLDFNQFIQNQGARTWINTLSDRLCGGRGDDINSEKNWQEVIDLGFSIIQTDHCIELKEYLLKTGQ